MSEMDKLNMEQLENVIGGAKVTDKPQEAKGRLWSELLKNETSSQGGEAKKRQTANGVFGA